MNYWDSYELASIGSVDVSGANSGVLEVAGPVDVKRIIAVITTSVAGDVAAITVSKREADGSGGATTLGSFSIPVAASPGVYFAELGDPSESAESGTYPDQTAALGSAVSASTVYSSEGGLFEVDVGDELVVTSDGGPSAGVVSFFAEYIKRPFSGSRIADATERTFTFA